MIVFVVLDISLIKPKKIEKKIPEVKETAKPSDIPPKRLKVRTIETTKAVLSLKI
ncbi:MAG: hypothetical protein HUU34_09880 [Saprospiraceae bacterium]|nr:hypothetical protein [Saprospiraceae bacterium]